MTDLSLEIASAAASTGSSEMSEEGSSCGSGEEKSKSSVTAVAATDSATTTTSSCDRVIPSSQSASVLSSASILENYPETPSDESKPALGTEEAGGCFDPGQRVDDHVAKLSKSESGWPRGRELSESGSGWSGGEE